MNLSEWLDNYRMIDFDRDHWCATGKDLERLWEFRGKQATAAQRERLCCGHPAACIEGGSSDPDAQVTMWCGACVELDRVREEERKRWMRVVERRWPHLRGIMADMIAMGEADDES